MLAHEIGHVANGDMVTLALIPGVVNTFVMFFARVIGHTVDRVVFKTERGHGIGFFITTIVAEIVLGLLASMIVMWFSRRREFRADAAGAQFGGRNAMIAALQRLKAEQDLPKQMPERLATVALGDQPNGPQCFRVAMRRPSGCAARCWLAGHARVRPCSSAPRPAAQGPASQQRAAQPATHHATRSQPDAFCDTLYSCACSACTASASVGNWRTLMGRR